MKMTTILLAVAMMGAVTLFFFSSGASARSTQRRMVQAPGSAVAYNQPAGASSAPITPPNIHSLPIALPPGAKLPDKSNYRFSGPYTYGNLSLFLVHGEDAMKGSFLTLQEAMEQKKIAVDETGNVNELAIENVSVDEDVFVQAGDIVKGGRQDRVIATDFIVPKKSGRMPIASFCVESGRWSARGQEQSAHFSSSNEQAPGKELKLAAKKDAAQGAVWQKVNENQDKLAQKTGVNVRSAQSASSLELTLENRTVQQSANDYVKALDPIIIGKSDCIGYVFAINGKLNNADIYATHELFVKLWPKLLRAAAVEALAEQQKDQRFEAPTQADVKQLVEEPEQAKPTEKAVSTQMKVYTRETDKDVLFESSDERSGKSLHKNYIRK